MPYVQDGVFRVYIKGNAARLQRAVAGLRLCTACLRPGLRKWEKPWPFPMSSRAWCNLQPSGVRLNKGQGNTSEYESSLLWWGKQMTSFLLALSSQLAQCEPPLSCCLPGNARLAPVSLILIFTTMC